MCLFFVMAETIRSVLHIALFITTNGCNKKFVTLCFFDFIFWKNKTAGSLGHRDGADEEGVSGLQ
jgi:hypothetical protein